MADAVAYRISGLSKLDALELKDEPHVSLEEAKLKEGTYGEVTLFTLTVTTMAISVLAAYLLRTHDGESFEEVIEDVFPDGTTRRRTIRYTRQHTEAPEAELIRQIRGG